MVFPELEQEIRETNRHLENLSLIAKELAEHNRIQRLVHNIYDDDTQTMIVPKDNPLDPRHFERAAYLDKLIVGLLPNRVMSASYAFLSDYFGMHPYKVKVSAIINLDALDRDEFLVGLSRRRGIGNKSLALWEKIINDAK